MTFMKLLCLMIGAPLFLGAVLTHIVVRVKMKSEQSDFDEVYHEFEDTDPAYAKYLAWHKWTIWMVSLSLLLLFLGVAI